MIPMAMHSLFDEQRRRDMQAALRKGKLAARLPAAEPPAPSTSPPLTRDWMGAGDSPYYVPLGKADKQLLRALFSDDLALATDALRKGADPDVRDVDSAHATVMSETRIVRAYGNTCLMMAAKRGNLDMVRLLIRHKADVNLDFAYGSCPHPTALSYARKGGFGEIERELLAAGATR